MKKVRDSFEKGYVDGRKDARRQQEQGVFASISDIFTPNPHYNPDGSESYKEGHKEGRHDGWKK